MDKKKFNVVGNNETENQELAKGIAFIKSRRAELNVVQMVETSGSYQCQDSLPIL